MYMKEHFLFGISQYMKCNKINMKNEEMKSYRSQRNVKDENSEFKIFYFKCVASFRDNLGIQ